MMTVMHMKEWRSIWKPEDYPNYPDEYRIVARINRPDDLDAAFEMTNHIEQDWADNQNVFAAFDDRRSTSVGDVVIILSDGSVHRVEKFGFKKLSV